MAAKRGSKRRRRGVLVSMRGAPTKPSRPSRGIGGKIFGWVGGAALGIVLLAVVILLGYQFLNPTVDLTRHEADVTVQSIAAPADYGGETDAAVFEIEGSTLYLPLEDDERQRVREGTVLHVRYLKSRERGAVRVEEWEVVGTAAPPSAEEPGAEDSPDASRN